MHKPLHITKKSSKGLLRIMFGQGLFHAFFGFETELKSGAVAWLAQGRWYGANNIKA